MQVSVLACQARSHGGSIRGNAPQILFVPPKNFVVPRNFFIKTHNENKTLSPLKMFCAP